MSSGGREKRKGQVVVRAGVGVQTFAQAVGWLKARRFVKEGSRASCVSRLFEYFCEFGPAKEARRPSLEEAWSFVEREFPAQNVHRGEKWESQKFAREQGLVNGSSIIANLGVEERRMAEKEFGEKEGDSFYEVKEKREKVKAIEHVQGMIDAGFGSDEERKQWKDIVKNLREELKKEEEGVKGVEEVEEAEEGVEVERARTANDEENLRNMQIANLDMCLSQDRYSEEDKKRMRKRRELLASGMSINDVNKAMLEWS